VRTPIRARAARYYRRSRSRFRPVEARVEARCLWSIEIPGEVPRFEATSGFPSAEELARVERRATRRTPLALGRWGEERTGIARAGEPVMTDQVERPRQLDVSTSLRLLITGAGEMTIRQKRQLIDSTQATDVAPGTNLPLDALPHYCGIECVRAWLSGSWRGWAQYGVVTMGQNCGIGVLGPASTAGSGPVPAPRPPRSLRPVGQRPSRRRVWHVAGSRGGTGAVSSNNSAERLWGCGVSWVSPGRYPSQVVSHGSRESGSIEPRPWQQTIGRGVMRRYR